MVFVKLFRIEGNRPRVMGNVILLIKLGIP